MTSMVRLQDRIAVLLGSGKSLDEVEREVIEPAKISGEQKAALWLVAWSIFHGVAPTGPPRHLAS
jgi:hypothetical protein